MQLAEELAKAPGGKLAGLFITIKDCIVVKDVESRAGSAILNGYVPLFDATVVSRLKKHGAIILGKTAQDAFGFGSFSVNVGKGFKIPKNPFDRDRTTGGSSGGAAGITKKADFPHVAIAESTGGSIVCPASFCGVFGLCPTYGRVSRYGLMDYANSLDKIGPIAKNIYDIALVMEIISGHDPNESTTLKAQVPKYTDSVNKSVNGMKVAIIRDLLDKADPEVKQKTEEAIKKLERAGVSTEEANLPLTKDYAIATYYLISTAEASTNLAKYCGMRYGAHEKLEGNFNEYFTKVRSLYFNNEAKRRIILGTFARMAGYRDAYYLKALKVRTKIIEEYKNVFKKYDAILTPTMPMLPPKFDDIKKLTPLQNYLADVLTVGPNLAGMPHLNIPVGEHEGLPIGVLLTADHLQEEKLIQLGSLF